jgi:cytochrome c5
MKTSIALALIVALLLPAMAFSQDQAMTGEQVYQKSCAVCHDSGVAGAPKLGDKAVWGPRIGEGMETLYNTALHGSGAMPAKGGNSSLSDAEVKSAVDYMAGKIK